jgi:peptidoglycan/xylan/chitin deacetylase (PgdA/CDA1 family)
MVNPAILVPAALAASVALAAYAGLSDESQLFGPSLVSPPEPDQLALTFDDGPNPAATPRLLEVLARHNARATFFLIGDYVRREPALTRQIHAAGHTVGNHTMHHPWLPRHSNATIRAEMAACSRILEDTIGNRVALFRPPHGARRPAVFRIARELNLQVVQWNLMVGDWLERPADDLLRRIERGIGLNRARRRGTNLVLHDGSQHTPRGDRQATVEAVSGLLQRLAHTRSGSHLHEQPAATRFVTPPAWQYATISTPP